MKIDDIEITQKIHEAAYSMNVGFQEMVEFYQKANSREINQMERIIKKNDWNAFKTLIKRVLGIDLQ